MNVEMLDQFVTGTLDVDLTDLEVANQNGILLKSSTGRLFLRDGETLTLQFQSSSIPGIFPSKNYGEFDGISIRGLTIDGWQFTTKVFLLKPLSHFPNTNSTVWNCEPAQLTLQRTVQKASDSPIHYLGYIDKLDCLFERESTYQNPHSQLPSTALDWLEIRMALGTIQVHQGESNFSKLKVEARRSVLLHEFNDEWKPFLDALSLRMGRRIDVLAALVSFGSNEFVHLFGFNKIRLKHSGKNPLVPLVVLNSMGSRFIEAAYQFLLWNKESPIIDFLYSIWDAELISRENHRLHTAIAIEGFSKHVNKLEPGSRCTQAELRRKEEEKHFKELKIKVLDLVKTIEFEAGHLNRMTKLIQRASLNDTSPAIKSAGESLGIIFSEDELRCWREMRHPLAHGDKVNFDEHEQDFFALQSMLYRMILFLIGWFGPVVPYGPYAKYFAGKPDETARRVLEIPLSAVKEIRRKTD